MLRQARRLNLAGFSLVLLAARSHSGRLEQRPYIGAAAAAGPDRRTGAQDRIA
jgi:hypothetical protein